MKNTTEPRFSGRFAWGSVVLGLTLLLEFYPSPVLAQSPFEITAPPAGSILSPGQLVTILWTGGDPAWSVDVQLIDVTPGFPFAVVAQVAGNVPNSGVADWTFPSSVAPYEGPCDHTYQFYVQNVQRTSWTYGPQFTVACGIAVAPGEMSGDAKVYNTTYLRAIYDAHLQCDVTKVDEKHDRVFEVKWDRHYDDDFDNDHSRGHKTKDQHPGDGKKFVMDVMTSASCTHNTNIILDDPKVGFDTHTGSGTGRVNGHAGYLIEWVLVDAGRDLITDDKQPDTADITITDKNNHVVYRFVGTISKGRNEALRDDDVLKPAK